MVYFRKESLIKVKKNHGKLGSQTLANSLTHLKILNSNPLNFKGNDVGHHLRKHQNTINQPD